MPNTYATELSLDAAHGHPEAPRPGRADARARVGELRRHRGRLHRLPRADGGRGGGARSRSRRGCGGATSSSSATRWPTGTCASILHRLWGDQPLSYRSWAVQPEPKPLEREFWRRRDVDVLELPLEEYVETLGSYAGCRAGRRERMSVAAGSPPSPYKGLAPFEDSELDALLFFGREREREVIVANLMASRLTVLYGPSGVGKSSVLRAAVARCASPESADAAVVVYSSWAGDPVRASARRSSSAVRNRVERHAHREARSLHSAGRRRRPLPHPRPVRGVLPLPRARRHSRDELAELIREPGLRANFLLGIREDALAQLDAFKGRIPNLFANYLRLDHLDRTRGRAAIVGPIERYNELVRTRTVEVEPALVEAVLDQVAGGRGRRRPAGRGRCRDGREAGSRRRTCSSCWSGSGRSSASAARTFSASRRSQELGGAECDRAGPPRAGAREPAARQSRTSRRRCSTTSSRRPARRSRTAPRDLAQYAACRRGRAHARARTPRPRAHPARGRRARRRRALRDLPRRARRRRPRLAGAPRARARSRGRAAAPAPPRRCRGAALVALAAMAAVAVFALSERSNARSAARQARARALDATALIELSTDPQRAVADAVAAARITPSSRAETVLRQALGAARLRRVLPPGGPVSIVAFASSGRRMLAGKLRRARPHLLGGWSARADLAGRELPSPHRPSRRKASWSWRREAEQRPCGTSQRAHGCARCSCRAPPPPPRSARTVECSSRRWPVEARSSGTSRPGSA